MNKLGLFLLLSVLGAAFAGQAQVRCEEVLLAPKVLSAAEKKLVRKGQNEVARALYELYLRRPDFRLQTLEIPGMTMRLQDAGKPLRYIEKTNSPELADFIQNEQAWKGFVEYADWRKSIGSSRTFKQATQPPYHQIPPVTTKSFGLPDIDFEHTVTNGFSPLKVPKSIQEKYPQLFVNRHRVEGLTAYEQTWNLAYQNLMHYLRSVLSTPAAERKIVLTPEQLEMITRVYENRGTLSSLRFIYDAKQGQAFKIGGASHRIAVTGDQLGSEILINTAFTDKQVDLATATGLLLHELAHHHAYKDTADRPLDKLAAVMTDYVRKTSEVKSIKGPNGENVQVILLRPVMMEQSKLKRGHAPLDAWGTRVVIHDGHQLWDITGDIIASMPNLDVHRLEFFTLRDFDANLKMLSEDKPGKQGYSLQLDFHILKDVGSGPISAERMNTFISFWMSKDPKKPGIVTWPGLDVSIFPNRVFPSEFAKKARFMPGKVLENKILTPQVKAGETARMTALVEIPEGVEIANAWIDFSSNKMRSTIGAMENQMHQVVDRIAGNVTVKKVGKNQVQIEASFPILPLTKSQELTLEQVNFMYTSGDFSYVKPKFKETLQIQQIQDSPRIEVVDLELKGGAILWPDKRIAMNIFNNQPAEVVLSLKNTANLTHIILVGDIEKVDYRGISTREGFVHNFAAGGSTVVSNMNWLAGKPGVTTNGEIREQILNFYLTTQKAVWGPHAKRIHLEGLYIRDINLEEKFIPFGTNFSIFLAN